MNRRLGDPHVTDRAGLWLRDSALARPAARALEWARAHDPRLRRRNAVLRRQAVVDGLPLPPALLMGRVAGTSDAGWFLEGGRLAAASMRDVLHRNGLDIAGFAAVLDFGCGCGRVLRHWRGLAGPALHGTDTSPEMIAWCVRHLPFAAFQTNDLAPPLPYPDATFDFAYALSVFTHLPYALQEPWAQELTRVVRPDGFLLLTVHGARYRAQLMPEEQQRFAAGELVTRHEQDAGGNRCTVFHPESWLRLHLARGLNVIAYVPEGALGNPFQDLVLLRKPETLSPSRHA
jgi:SAM-dependent methyltransferase